MQPGLLLDEREPESAAIAAGGAAPLEPAPDAITFGGGDPGTVVVDDEPQPGRRRRDADADARRAVPCRVLDQVELTGLRADAGYTYTSGRILTNSGHLRVTVSPREARVAYVRSYLPKDASGSKRNGAVVTSYPIAPRP